MAKNTKVRKWLWKAKWESGSERLTEQVAMNAYVREWI